MLKAFIRWAVAEAQRLGPPATPKSVLEAILFGRFTTDVRNGKTVISTSEAGGSVTFSFSDSLSPSDIIAVAEQALEWLESQPDPDNPDMSGLARVKRLRAAFDRMVPL
jgi:hypothetical protein